MGLVTSLEKFVTQCEGIEKRLESAKAVETLDTFTSNRSLGGFCVSVWSNIKNHSVAKGLDELAHAMAKLNVHLAERKLPQLACHLNGQGIRNAEGAEHQIFSWRRLFLGNETHEGLASMETSQQLANAKERVKVIKEQAIGLLTRVEAKKGFPKVREVPKSDPHHCRPENEVSPEEVSLNSSKPSVLPAKPKRKVKVVTVYRDREPEQISAGATAALVALFCAAYVTSRMMSSHPLNRPLFGFTPWSVNVSPWFRIF